MPARSTLLTISDIRGGINNSDSPTELQPNQIVDARNVDLRAGALGAKRRGTAGIDLTGSAFNSPVVALFRHTPTNVLSNDELWAIDENGNIDRRVGGTWQGGIARVNDHVTVSSRNYDANAVSLHGKLFIAAKGEQDRLLVWDGSALRWAGIQQPPDPTVANSASAGTYTGTRYFRIRYTQQASGATVRRSEPTNAVPFVPSGSKDGAVITKPIGTELTSSVYCEGQTHWEIEASIDNVLFYRIATVAIGTGTYTDTTPYTTGYSAFPLSELLGEYLPPRAIKHLAVDEDRVVLAGSHFTPGFDATVWWTPVAADDGVGNDERIPDNDTASNAITFDGLDGGSVTALVSGISGNVYVFKSSRIYKMVRTGILASAYESVAESFSRGSTPRGATAGTDAAGLPCAYFLDPVVGLCRFGRNGAEDLGRPIRETWLGRNPAPAISPRIIYYPALEQVWYTSPVNSPDIIQTSDQQEIHTFDDQQIVTSQTVPTLLVIYEVRYGGLLFHDGVPGSALALGLTFRDTGLAPIIGTNLTDIGAGNTSYIHFGDTGSTDSNGSYRGYVRTQPYALGSLWQKFGLMAAVVMAKAAAGTSLFLRMVRNLGIETRDVFVDLAPAGTEPYVIKPVDNASLSELNTVQLEYGDQAASAQPWSVDRIVLRVREEESAA